MIYFGEAVLVKFSDPFSLNRTTIRLKRSRNPPKNRFISLRLLLSDDLLSAFIWVLIITQSEFLRQIPTREKCFPETFQHAQRLLDYLQTVQYGR